jgi:hypothetical protein
MAMTKPDLELIAQVMLFSQGFRTAETLASKIVPFFNLCSEQLSPQPHYDFGLRALKAVLVSAGILKRDRLAAGRKNVAEGGVLVDASDTVSEQEILIQSVRETIVPKLVANDVPLLMRYPISYLSQTSISARADLFFPLSPSAFSPTSSPESITSPSISTPSSSRSRRSVPNAGS